MAKSILSDTMATGSLSALIKASIPALILLLLLAKTANSITG